MKLNMALTYMWAFIYERAKTINTKKVIIQQMLEKKTNNNNKKIMYTVKN